MNEHVRDPFVQRAQAEGYRSRAAYKLIELDERDRLLAPGCVVVDLGAAPGSWSQVAARRVGPRGVVIALDLLPVEPIPGVTVLQGDFAQAEVAAALGTVIGERRVDLVLSDMAPNISGIASADRARAESLAELAGEFAFEHLKPGGSLVVKLFQSAEADRFVKSLRASFGRVVTRKPDASRDRSSEHFVVARDFGRRSKAE